MVVVEEHELDGVADGGGDSRRRESQPVLADEHGVRRCRRHDRKDREEDAEAEGDVAALQPLKEVALTLKDLERVTIRGLGDLSRELSPATLWQTITRREMTR